uniref:Rab-GAP TBC domain-containing protein n=1 Tax=Globodera pallida TaxID=36090 RepID=A0A183BKM7_GLOPA
MGVPLTLSTIKTVGISTYPNGHIPLSDPCASASSSTPTTDTQSCSDQTIDEELQSVDTPEDPEVASVLSKMEQLNRSNEADVRSVASKRSSDSHAGRSSSPKPPMDDVGHSLARNNSLQPTIEDDENLDLWAVWGNLVKSWDTEMKRRPNCVKELVRRGIPQHFRTIAWQLLSGAHSTQIHDLYAEYIRQSSPYEKAIARDIPRTFPELEFFKDGGRGQQSLFNVIKAYSLHDREVGYCQGSAFIVGQLLLQMPEEEAFAVFMRLMETYRLRELYKPTMTELGLCMFQLEVIVQEQMPDLHMHFNNMGFDTSMYASSWFLTVFLTTVSLDLANRIMDWFLVDGIDAIFRIAISILQQSRIDLLQLDMEGMLKYFQREVRERFENDHELLFAIASKVHLNVKRMKRLEKEYMTKKTKEQEEAIELRRLRTENRLLRQRIDYLERESSALADRLVRGQVDLAQQADACLNISHELNTLRDINSEAHRRLEDAYETIRELSCKRAKDKIDQGAQIDDTSMIEHIHQLQQELIEAHTKKADLENIAREFRRRTQELESTNKRLKECPPDGGIALIQEELIQVKMREAEASLSLKEMRQKLAEVYESPWDHCRPTCFFSEPCQSPTPPSSNQQNTQQHHQNPSQSARARIAKLTATLMGAVGSNVNINNSSAIGESGGTAETLEGWSQRELEDNFIGLKIREADTVAELKEMRQKVMEMETQNHVCTNQLKRQDEEIRRLREERDTFVQMERELREELRGNERKLVVSQSEMKEKNVMQRLKYTEALQAVAELKQQIAQLESKNAEKAARAQIRGSSVYGLDNESLASSTRSVASLDGIQSLPSEEMAAFIAGVKSGKNRKNEDEEEEDEGAETETNEAETGQGNTRG